MNKIILIIIVVLVIILGGYFIYYTYQSPTYKTNTTTTGNQQGNLNNTVTVENFNFSPASLTIKEGTTVTWINQDSAPHQIKSNTFNSSTLNKGGNFQFTFSTAGEYSYFCSIHPSMQGRIIVQ